MKFMVTFELDAETRMAAIEEFLSSGAPAPEGVKMLGRWHSVNMNIGYTLCETDDLAKLGRWTHEWANMLHFDIQPVMDDEEAGAMFKSAM